MKITSLFLLSEIEIKPEVQEKTKQFPNQLIFKFPNCFIIILFLQAGWLSISGSGKMHLRCIG